jgi:hypothetical protein
MPLAWSASYPIKDVSGSREVVMETDASLPDHTIYRPLRMNVGKPYPVLAFGNGGCANIGNLYEKVLGEIASHGYVVVAAGEISAAVMAGQAPTNTGPPVQSRTQQMIETLDWAQRMNRTAGSIYRGRLDVRHMALAGHSCGGLEALAAGKDPRVATVLVLDSGIIRGGIPNPDGTTRQPAGYLPASDADLPLLHTPMLYVMGGKTDQAWRGAEGDFEAIKSLPIFNANLDVGHSGTWREPRGGEMGRVALAWLNWQLKGDRNAAKMFRGADCGLCKDPRWVVKSKNLR